MEVHSTTNGVVGAKKSEKKKEEKPPVETVNNDHATFLNLVPR